MFNKKRLIAVATSLSVYSYVCIHGYKPRDLLISRAPPPKIVLYTYHIITFIIVDYNISAAKVYI